VRTIPAGSILSLCVDRPAIVHWQFIWDHLKCYPESVCEDEDLMGKVEDKLYELEDMVDEDDYEECPPPVCHVPERDFSQYVAVNQDSGLRGEIFGNVSTILATLRATPMEDEDVADLAEAIGLSGSSQRRYLKSLLVDFDLDDIPEKELENILQRLLRKIRRECATLAFESAPGCTEGQAKSILAIQDKSTLLGGLCNDARLADCELEEEMTLGSILYYRRKNIREMSKAEVMEALPKWISRDTLSHSLTSLS